jgi:hypothetical protein
LAALAAMHVTNMKELKMASKNITTVDTRAELAELVKRKAEIAVCFDTVTQLIMYLKN